MERRIGLLCAALTGLFVLAGATCSPPGQNGTGTLRVLVTDKPFPFEFIESAVVTLTRVSVHKAGEGAQNQSEGEGDSAWITVFEDAEGKPFDLVDLRNGRTKVLSDAELPAGQYDQMRLVVSGGEVKLTDGRTFSLKVPSGDTSGIKLHFTFEVLDGEPTDLLLDIDLSRAFRAIPGGKIDTPDQIQQFHFQPSIAMRLINLVEAGSISGVVTDTTGAPVAAASVTAYLNDVEVTSTQTEEDGTYSLVGLVTGSYQVTFSAAGFEDAETNDVSVTAGQDTADVDAVLEALEPVVE